MKSSVLTFHASERVRSLPFERMNLGPLASPPISLFLSLAKRSGSFKTQQDKTDGHPKQQQSPEFLRVETRSSECRNNSRTGNYSVRHSTVRRGSTTIRVGRSFDTNRNRFSGPFVTTTPNRSSFLPVRAAYNGIGAVNTSSTPDCSNLPVTTNSCPRGLA